jgi:RNA polymerase sigma-70 factor (ECF subfamily)
MRADLGHATLCGIGVSECRHGTRGRLNDDALIERVLAGDPAAQRALYDAHVDRVYRLAYRFAGDADLARDFTQDTFIRAFDRLGTFKRRSSFSTWLHSIGVSVALNGLRSVRRIRERETNAVDAETMGVARVSSEPDLKERLARAIDALAEGYRAVFVMHDVEGYTHEEIGVVLGIETGTSKAQLSRARAKLRTALADFAGEWIA